MLQCGLARQSPSGASRDSLLVWSTIVQVMSDSTNMARLSGGSMEFLHGCDNYQMLENFLSLKGLPVSEAL